MDPKIAKKWAALQKTFEKELKRREKVAKSPAEIMRGFDDFCREKTARFLFENPSFTSEWISIRAAELFGDLAAAKSEMDYVNLLNKLSMHSPIAKATSECPQYALLPPTVKTVDQWMSLLEPLFFPKANMQCLIENGFMPINGSAVKQALAKLGHKNVDFHCTYTLIDTDYGIAILPPSAPQKNVALDIAMLMRYMENAPTLIDHPSEIFDVGIVRGGYFYNGRIPDQPTLISIDVASRQELDSIISRLCTNITSNGRYEIWFRGQPKEYLLPDLRREALQGICPWRSVQDISQVPSLYRNVTTHLSDLRSYCQGHIEVHKYYLFMKETLGIPTYTTRVPGESEYELFNKNWGRQFPEITSSMSVGDGETVEHHDTHFAFRSLQAALFLQHYGLESNVLDLTNDIDVALFFAQKEVIDNSYIDIDYSQRNPVLYFFILDKELDPFMNTSELLENYEVLRPKRQHCGIIAGASLITNNYYSRFISLKINLKAQIDMNYHEPEYLFPGPNEDIFLSNLIEFSNLQNMSFATPFFLGN